MDFSEAMDALRAGLEGLSREFDGVKAIFDCIVSAFVSCQDADCPEADSKENIYLPNRSCKLLGNLRLDRLPFYTSGFL